MAKAQFPEPADLKVPFKDMIGDGTSVEVGKWTVSNPHPGFGKDPNILNEYGHTKYPMWVYSEIEGKRIIVANAEEEAKHTKKPEAVAAKPAKPSKEAWPS